MWYLVGEAKTFCRHDFSKRPALSMTPEVVNKFSFQKLGNEVLSNFSSIDGDS